MKIRTIAGVTAFLIGIVATTLAGGAAQQGRVDEATRNGWSPYAIGLWGDLPYSPVQAASACRT